LSYYGKKLFARDETFLNISCLKDKSLADLDNLPGPDVLAEEIEESLETALASFQEVLRRLSGEIR
jgi:type I restriction enzyme M protein